MGVQVSNDGGGGVSTGQDGGSANAMLDASEANTVTAVASNTGRTWAAISVLFSGAGAELHEQQARGLSFAIRGGGGRSAGCCGRSTPGPVHPDF